MKPEDNHHHPHDHHDHHDHHHDSPHKLSDMEKLAHLLDHWRSHNQDHEANYRDWAEKALTAGQVETAGFLREAADITAKVTDLFVRAGDALSSSR